MQKSALALTVAAIGIFATQASAGIIASENFGGDFTPGTYGPGQLSQNSGTGWSNTWYVGSGSLTIGSGNLSHALSPLGTSGYKMTAGAARRDFSSTSDISFSFISTGAILFDIEKWDSQHPINVKPIDIQYFSDGNGHLKGRLTYWDENDDYQDTGYNGFSLPNNITDTEAMMTIVEVTSSNEANFWFLPNTATAYDPYNADMTISVLDQPYDRVVTIPGGLDNIVIGTSVSDVAPQLTPAPGAAGALAMAGMLAMGRRRRER